MSIDSSTDAPPAPRAGQPQSALRTFLTADVRGYTRFTQEFGDEAAAKLAIKFAAVSREVVADHGGEVIELRGDEALAVFTSARQALRSSIRLQSRFRDETERDPELPLRVGIGLDAGEVVPVEEGYRGGALNLAARLSSLAGPGEVLASDTAIHLARRTKGLVFSERGLVELKGFAEPVRVIRVLDEADQRSEAISVAPAGRAGRGANGHERGVDDTLPIGGFLGALPEGLLVARDEEFNQILGSIQAVERGSGRLVLLAGEPGVGKTRLAQEVTLKARNHSFIMATGRCYEPEATVPFYPFLEALATLYGVSPEHTRSQLPHRWPEVERLLPNQSPAQSAPLGESQDDQQRLFWAVTGFLQAVSVERPVTLMLDDLHWADGSSLELLQHLVRHTRANRVLLLGTYRDVEVNRQHPLEAALRDLGRERLVDQIEIRRLEENGTGELVAATLGGDDVASAFVRLIHRQTEGNPFFVEEVVRTLVDRGDVVKVHGRWEGRALEDLEVPKSIRSVVGQRLSRLEPCSQEVLQEASVLGPAFAFEDLLRMCEREESQIETALEDAVGAGIVRESGRDSYSFNHTLTQGTLYAELPARKRRRLHLAAGKALEKLPESTRRGRIAELAWHFLEADEPAPALEYAMLAGREARLLFAYEEAERHYRTALELARELNDGLSEVRSLEELGRILRTVARYDDALQVLDEAVDLHRAAGNAAGERWTTAHIGRVHALRGSAQQGIERVQALINAIEATGRADAEETNGEGPVAGLAALYAALANMYQETGQSSAQLEAAEKAMDVASQAQDSKAGARIQAESQMWRAAALAELGELNDARRMLEDVIPLVQAGDPLVLSRSLNTLASIYSEAGQYETEQGYIERALEAAEETGDPTRVAFMNHRLGWHHLMLGRWSVAQTYLERAAEMWRAMGWTSTAPWTVLALAFLALVRGEVETGERYLSHGLRAASRQGADGQLIALAHWLALDRYLREGNGAAAIEYADAAHTWPTDDWTYAFLLPVRAWTELERGNIDHAEDLANEATERATAENNRTILVEALRVQGLILCYQGNFEDSDRVLAESLSMARAVEQPYAEARSLEVYGRMQLEWGEHHAAIDLLGASLSIFQRLGAIPDAARVGDILRAAQEEPAPSGLAR